MNEIQSNQIKEDDAALPRGNKFDARVGALTGGGGGLRGSISSMAVYVHEHISLKVDGEFDPGRPSSMHYLDASSSPAATAQQPITFNSIRFNSIRRHSLPIPSVYLLFMFHFEY